MAVLVLVLVLTRVWGLTSKKDFDRMWFDLFFFGDCFLLQKNMKKRQHPVMITTPVVVVDAIMIIKVSSASGSFGVDVVFSVVTVTAGFLVVEVVEVLVAVVVFGVVVVLVVVMVVVVIKSLTIVVVKVVILVVVIVNVEVLIVIVVAVLVAGVVAVVVEVVILVVE